MTQTTDIGRLERSEEEIDLRELWQTLKQGWLIIALIVVLATSASVYYAVTAQPRYQAEVLAAQSDSGSSGNGKLAAFAGQFGGLASLAGVDLASSGNVDESVAILNSRNFASSFIADNNLMPVFFSSQWDAGQKNWKNADPNRQPTLNDGINFFNTIRVVTKDKKSGLIRVSIEWHDPKQAAEWANNQLTRVNSVTRDRAIAESEKTLQFLEQEIGKTSVVEVRQALYSLIEAQVKTISLARTREEYAFKVIDPAVAPDLKSPIFPKKRQIVLIGFIGGFFIGCACIFLTKALTGKKLMPLPRS